MRAVLSLDSRAKPLLAADSFRSFSSFLSLLLPPQSIVSLCCIALERALCLQRLSRPRQLGSRPHICFLSLAITLSLSRSLYLCTWWRYRTSLWLHLRGSHSEATTYSPARFVFTAVHSLSPFVLVAAPKRWKFLPSRAAVSHVARGGSRSARPLPYTVIRCRLSLCIDSFFGPCAFTRVFIVVLCSFLRHVSRDIARSV